MGIANLFSRSGLVYNEATGVTPGISGVKSPWANSAHLSPVSLSGTIPDGTVSIVQALKVPPVARVVQLISTTIASMPLVAEGPGAETVMWLDNTFGAVTARHRSAHTAQDILFTAAAVWWVEERDGNGYPLELTRLPRHLWTLDQQGYVCTIDGHRLDTSKAIYMPGLLELGFLEYGADSIREYSYMGNQIRNRARAGKPVTDLHVTDQYEPTKAEAEQVVKDWVAARLSENGAVAFSPWWLDVRELGSDEVSPLSGARNAVRLDVANFLNINAELVDGNNGGSDTYSNTLQNVNELLALTLRGFLTPIEQRLSQDDVTPHGVTVRFDTSKFDALADAKGNTGTAVASPAPNQEVTP